ncbi:SPOR domain-containing protein [Kordiimonas sp. SCSIO 12610]|uniref:SPOR domain-containing protein n=1 Tax=Kordiimonas sp. SCSIO 12610 TaxID=2829597 RepID=UPI0021098BE5|nr:SPOR domain-containing protein [Kordiimonas sp. SCSIO 12610]UTW55240.1 hypothetical protein KFF44_15770 [Kordiimonas sp. SCSIO 12610]
MKRLKSSSLMISCVIILSACGAGNSLDTTNINDPDTLGANEVVTLGPIETAICENRPEGVPSILSQFQSFQTYDRFLSAYAYELDGHPIRAKAIYTSLDKTTLDDTAVSLTCGNTKHFEGTIRAIITMRLSAIDSQLKSLGVNFVGPLKPLHAGLAAAPRQPIQIVQTPTPEPIVRKAAEKPKAIKPNDKPSQANPFFKPLEVTLPESVNANGRWFSHIASYGTLENANSYRSRLEDKYPALVGHIQDWQVTAKNGTAWRLGVRVNEWSDADRLCVIIRSKEEYCRVLDTAK